MVSEFVVYVCEECGLQYATWNSARRCEIDHVTAIA